MARVRRTFVTSRLMSSEAFLQAGLSLFVIIDPIGNLVVFRVLTRHLTRTQRFVAALTAVAIAGLLLGAFALGGSHLLGVLGVTPASFRVAAGLLLLPTAYNLVVVGELPEVRSRGGLDPVDLAVVPLAVPLLAGPAALAAVIAYEARLGLAVTLAAAAAVLVICGLAFVASGPIFRLLGEPVMRLATRLVGLVLFAIATEFVLSGAAATLRGA